MSSAQTREMSDSQTTLHFIRHGHAVPEPDTTLADAEDYDDMGLSRKGAAQAAALVRRLRATTPVEAVYSSPTRRALQTAQPIARAFGCEAALEPRVREIALGAESYGHVPTAERATAMRARLRELAAVALRDGSWDSVPGTEPAHDVLARVRAAIDDIVARHPGAHVAIVSHAGSIESYVASVLGIARPFFYPIYNTSLNTIRVSDGRATVLRLNDIAHLEGAQIPPDR